MSSSRPLPNGAPLPGSGEVIHALLFSRWRRRLPMLRTQRRHVLVRLVFRLRSRCGALAVMRGLIIRDVTRSHVPRVGRLNWRCRKHQQRQPRAPEHPVRPHHRCQDCMSMLCGKVRDVETARAAATPPRATTAQVAKNARISIKNERSSNRSLRRRSRARRLVKANVGRTRNGASSISACLMRPRLACYRDSFELRTAIVPIFCRCPA